MSKQRARRDAGVFLLAAITLADLRPAARQLFEQLGIKGESFPGWVRQVAADTTEREREGEGDHLIYYVLQSRQFTRAMPIEPALSAREFVHSGEVPEPVRHRLQEFLEATPEGERMTYLRHMVPHRGALGFLNDEYVRAMRSLYAKEFENKPAFYQTRGHSTDTQIPANYGIWTALSALHAEHPELTISRVLIVGPGLDFAPRTSMDDRYPPQSYQPYAVLDALKSTGLFRNTLIHCIDINDRVVRFFSNFPRRNPPVLHLASPPGDADYLRYFDRLGEALGDVRPKGALEKEVTMTRRDAGLVTTEKMNIITERSVDSGASYDLVIATNVFVYFKNPELLAALLNISSMMDSGGYLLHNEVRPESEAYARAAGLRLVEARTVRVASGSRAPLYDSFTILRK